METGTVVPAALLPALEGCDERACPVPGPSGNPSSRSRHRNSILMEGPGSLLRRGVSTHSEPVIEDVGVLPGGDIFCKSSGGRGSGLFCWFNCSRGSAGTITFFADGLGGAKLAPLPLGCAEGSPPVLDRSGCTSRDHGSLTWLELAVLDRSWSVPPVEFDLKAGPDAHVLPRT